MQRELCRIQAEVRKTIVFVTHDICEAFLLGDRIVLMNDGRFVQDGTPADLLRRPADPFVTDFVGEDRGLRALRFTPLAELAEPAPMGVPANGPVLPGGLSVLEAARQVGRGGDGAGDGFWVGDEAGRPTRYLSYHRFAAVLGETIAADAAPGDGAADGLPA